MVCEAEDMCHSSSLTSTRSQSSLFRLPLPLQRHCDSSHLIALSLLSSITYNLSSTLQQPIKAQHRTMQSLALRHSAAARSLSRAAFITAPRSSPSSPFSTAALLRDQNKPDAAGDSFKRGAQNVSGHSSILSLRDLVVVS